MVAYNRVFRIKETGIVSASVVLAVLAVACGSSEAATVPVPEAGLAINTVAGTGEDDLSGDGGPALSATLSSPLGVAVDSEGNLFIGDTGNHRVRRVDADTGIITTVAGSIDQEGFWAGFRGDGGPAVGSQLSSPEGVAVDRDGNLYIADRSNHRIRRVDADTGIITTVVGNGEETDSVFGAYGGDGGAAIDAQLNRPKSVAVDREGNIYIADTSNHRIRKVDAGSGIITTVAGSGPRPWYGGDGGPATVAVLAHPHDVAADRDANIFIADTGNNRIRRVDALTGVITTVAGGGANVHQGGPATDTYVPTPTAVVVDGAANIFITDVVADRILRVDAETGIITAVAGTGVEGYGGDGGPATGAQLGDPWALAVNDAGVLIVSGKSNHRVRRIGLPGTSP